MRGKDDVSGVLTANEKIIVFMQENQKLVFDNVYKLQKQVMSYFLMPAMV